MLLHYAMLCSQSIRRRVQQENRGITKRGRFISRIFASFYVRPGATVAALAGVRTARVEAGCMGCGLAACLMQR